MPIENKLKLISLSTKQAFFAENRTKAKVVTIMTAQMQEKLHQFCFSENFI